MLLRILTNYVQAVIIVKDFNLEWPNQIFKSFEWASFIMSSEEMNVSIECFNYLLHSSNMIPSSIQHYIKVMLIGVFPFTLTLVSLMFWIAANIILLRWQKT